MFELKFKRLTAAFDFSFFATVALLALIGGTNAVLGLDSCIWHELGHLFVMRMKGISVKKILFYGAGIKIVPDKQLSLTGFGTELLVLSGGAAANFAAAAVLCFFGNRRFKLAAAVNAAIGAFNLLPLQTLDGGRIIVLLIRRFCGYTRACMLESWLKRINIFLIITVLIAFVIPGKGNFTLYVTLCYLLVVSMSKGM